MLDQLLSLRPGARQDIIQIKNSRMHLHVYNLRYDEFQAGPADEVYYIKEPDPLALLVHHRDEQQADVLHLIIQWYLVTYKQITAPITLMDPRPAGFMRVIK